MTFRVGQKVVRIAVNSTYNGTYSLGDWPSCIKVGGVYTIRDADTRAAKFGWPVVLRFEEFVEALLDNSWAGLGMWEPGFPGDCFRPIVELKTDISFAHEILRDVSRKETVRA
jgi:hypothetical protein